MMLTMMINANISACFVILICFSCYPAIAETWRCEPKSGFEKLGSKAPKDFYHYQILMLNIKIQDGDLKGAIVSDDPYSLSLKSNYTSSQYRTFSDVSRWTIHVFKLHGTFNIGSVVDVRRSLTSHDLFQVFDYLCIRRS